MLDRFKIIIEMYRFTGQIYLCLQTFSPILPKRIAYLGLARLPSLLYGTCFRPTEVNQSNSCRDEFNLRLLPFRERATLSRSVSPHVLNNTWRHPVKIVIENREKFGKLKLFFTKTGWQDYRNWKSYYLSQPVWPDWAILKVAKNSTSFRLFKDSGFVNTPAYPPSIGTILHLLNSFMNWRNKMAFYQTDFATLGSDISIAKIDVGKRL